LRIDPQVIQDLLNGRPLKDLGRNLRFSLARSARLCLVRRPARALVVSIELISRMLAMLTLRIIGGNDTTRISIAGGLLAVHQNPDQWQKQRDNPSLATSAVSEIVRWHTPLSHMRRITVADVEVNGQRIPAGSRVIIWYLSGNRDEQAIENPHSFIIGRPRTRQHLSFGFGVHGCVDNRLAEMQLRLSWEGTLSRKLNIEVAGAATRVRSNLIHSLSELTVLVH